jgi:peptidoglycan/LPS O-acetylase OafA/YrhL
VKQREVLSATFPPARARARLAQVVVAVAGVGYVLAGVALLFAPVWFFQHIGTFGPFNRHYEGDLGAFLLALGIGLLFAARSPSRCGLVVWVGAVGSLLHACNHIYDALMQGATPGQWLAQPVPLVALALLLIWAASQDVPAPKRAASR